MDCQILNSSFWPAKILKSRFWMAKILNSRFWTAKILNSRYWTAKILNSRFWKTKILNSRFWVAKSWIQDFLFIYIVILDISSKVPFHLLCLLVNITERVWFTCSFDVFVFVNTKFLSYQISLSCIWKVQTKVTAVFSADCTIGMVWGLSSLNHYGNKALLHYGTMEIRCKL